MSIVKNNKNKEKLKKYIRWFDFASKSKNDKNTKADFKEYETDKIFSEVIKRLRKDRLGEDEMRYIATEEEFKKLYIEHSNYLLEKTKEVEEKTKEVEKERKEKEKAQVEKEKAQTLLKTSIKTLLSLGLTKEKIAQTLNISLEIVEELI